MKHVVQDGSGAWRFDEYFAYLESVKERLPLEVYAFASAWAHYSLDNPSSLHDAWVDAFTVRELAEGERSEVRTTEAVLRLLAPYHDRAQVLRYRGVTSYTMTSPSVGSGHGDLIVHEVTLVGERRVQHELLFDTGSTLTVECESFSYEEQSLSPAGGTAG